MKTKILDSRGIGHFLLPLLFVVIFAVAGIAYVVVTNAESTITVARQKITAREAAKELIKSDRLTDRDGRYMKQIRAVANGSNKCNVNPYIIKMLYGVVVKDGHRVTISSLNRKCTRVLTASGASSYHYRARGGHAIDVVSFDGNPTNGGNTASRHFLKAAAKYLPKKTGYGQVQCGSGFKIPKGGYGFNDTCNHQHVQVPVKRLKL